jgi:hypothetical protein
VAGELLTQLVVSDTPDGESSVTALLTLFADVGGLLNAKAVGLQSSEEIASATSELRISRLPLDLPRLEGVVVASAPDGAYWTWDLTVKRLPGTAWSVERRLEWAQHVGRTTDWELLWEANDATYPTSEALARELLSLVEEVMALAPAAPSR